MPDPDDQPTVSIDLDPDGHRVPAMPDEDPKLGDKTPAVVEWYAEHDPAEFKRRYQGRKTHLGPVFN